MDIEAQAREQGWVPKEEWKGPEDKWTEASVFVEKGEKISGILKSRVDRQQQEIDRLKQTNKEFGESRLKIEKKLRQDNERLERELESAREQAITDGDGATFTRVEKQLSQVRQDLAPPSNGNVSNPLGEQWLADNEWYNTNPKLQTFADGLADKIISEGYSGRAYFAELTRRTKEAFPDDFSNHNRSGANSVESGGNQSVKSKEKKSYDNLPQYAKDSCDKFVKNGLITKEEYVKTFEWEK